MRVGVLQAHDQAEQWRGGGFQRIESDAGRHRAESAAVGLGERGGGVARWWGRAGTSAARRRPNDGAVAFVAVGGKRIVDGHGSLLAYSLMAQNAMSKPGNSPPTWKAKPPEVSTCFQNSLLRSSRK